MNNEMRESFCPVKLPMVLYEILVELSVRGRVLGLLICPKKCLDVIGVPFRHRSPTNIVKEKF
jgi:hypothetical protein